MTTIKDLLLKESYNGHVSIANRRVDTENKFDTAVSKFVFAWNLLADGMTMEQASNMWKLTPWYVKGDDLFTIFKEN